MNSHCLQIDVQKTRRSGAALLLAVMLLALAGTVSASLVRTVLVQRERLQLRADRHQAELLARAAILYAQQKLRQDSNFTADVWSPELSPGSDLTAIVRVEINEPDSAPRLVTIRAELSRQGIPCQQITLTHLLDTALPVEDER